MMVMASFSRNLQATYLPSDADNRLKYMAGLSSDKENDDDIDGYISPDEGLLQDNTGLNNDLNPTHCPHS